MVIGSQSNVARRTRHDTTGAREVVRCAAFGVPAFFAIPRDDLRESGLSLGGIALLSTRAKSGERSSAVNRPTAFEPLGTRDSQRLEAFMRAARIG